MAGLRLRLVHDRRLPQGLRRHGESQHRDVGRQQPAADRRPGLGRRPRRRRRHRPDGRTSATRWPRGRSACHRPRLPARQLRHDRGARAALDQRGRRGRWLLPHPRRYPLGDRYLDPFREAIDIGRRAAAPSHITHFYHRETHPGGPGDAARSRRPRRGGPRHHLDSYPYEWASTRLLIQLPQWVQAGARPHPRADRGTDRA